MTPNTTRRPMNRSEAGAMRDLLLRYRDLYLTSTGSPRPPAPHPGDVLYWVGCVGVLSALLFVATR